MGKSKQRNFAKARNDRDQLQLSRIEAVKSVCIELNKNPASIEARKTISLFGLTAEELAEAGITYEVLRTLDGLI